MMRRLNQPDADVRNQLAGHNFNRRGRHGEQVFHGAALALAGDSETGHHDHRQGEDDTHQAGHHVVLRNAVGIEQPVNPHIERAGCSRQRSQRPG